MISSSQLAHALLEAFTKKTTWYEASSRYSLDEIIETFYATRQNMQTILEGLTDAHVAFASPAHPFWTLSETVTHLIYSQGFYHNKLLDITTSQLPHIVEAAKGFGEGAKQNIPAATLRQQLVVATEQIHFAIESTRANSNHDKTENSSAFGVCNYRTWAFLLLGHEVDHVRQATLVRRVALAEVMK